MLRRSGLSNDRAGLHKELGFLLLLFIAGCTVIEVPQPKRYDCTPPVDDAWACQSLVSDVAFNCYYTRKNNGG